MRARPLLGLAVVLAAGAAAAAPPSGDAHRAAERASATRARIVTVDGVRGEPGSPAVRTALREALSRHLTRRGFTVVEGGKNIAYRLQPTLLVVDAQDRSDVEVKASVVATDRKGRVVAMVEGGARTRGGGATAPLATLESQAVEAAARSLAEDLARRLLEVR